VVDPTKDELQKVVDVSGIPLDFLLLPESHNVVNLRLEPDFGVINFVIVREIFGKKRINPIVLAFSRVPSNRGQKRRPASHQSCQTKAGQG